ncbi:MAG: hypothetical protein Rubg2KO_23370 [Rubricoccaceae bacterium]
MSTRTALLFLLGFIAVSQLLATHQRVRLNDQRKATNQAVTDLARVANAVQTWTIETQEAGGGVARLTDVSLDDLGLDGSPCADTSTDAACFDSADLHIELRRDSADGVEIVAAGHNAAILATARVRGAEHGDVDIEILR